VNPSKTQLAVLNDICWYEAMFQAHGLSNTLDGLVWLSRETPRKRPVWTVLTA
jgi:hypothetical protein